MNCESLFYIHFFVFAWQNRKVTSERHTLKPLLMHESVPRKSFGWWSQS